MIESTGSMGRSATYAEELFVAEITRLKQELSLAKEGLANYAQENKWLRGILSEWQFDVGGASERLEQKTLAALNGVPEPQPDKP